MIITLHTPQGIVNIDSDKVTDSELAELDMTREKLNAILPRDIPKELDALKTELKAKGLID